MRQRWILLDGGEHETAGRKREGQAIPKHHLILQLLPTQSQSNSLMAQPVKNPPVIEETWVQSLGQEDALEKGMATHFQYYCLENSKDREAW